MHHEKARIVDDQALRDPVGDLLYVLIATPLGEGGKGGIDRIMDHIRASSENLRERKVAVHFGTTRGDCPLALSIFLFLRFLLTLAWLRSRRRCDVLHVNVASNGSSIRKSLLCEAARLLGIATVVHLHGSGYDTFLAAASNWKKMLVHRMFGRAERVAVLGSHWHRFVVEKGLVESARVRVLPNASASFPLQQDSRWDEDGCDTKPVKVIFLGVHGHRKGVFDLVAALASVRSNRRWHAVLAGNGEFERTAGLVTELGLGDRVSVPGWLDGSETCALLRSSDILVLPSYAENLPMSVIEGMAAGLAVISTRVGATEDIIIDRKTGLLVSPGDVAAISRALTELIDNAELRRELGQNARAFHSQHLEIKSYIERLAGIWSECEAAAFGHRRPGLFRV